MVKALPLNSGIPVNILNECRNLDVGVDFHVIEFQLYDFTFKKMSQNR